MSSPAPTPAAQPQQDKKSRGPRKPNAARQATNASLAAINAAVAALPRVGVLPPAASSSPAAASAAPANNRVLKVSATSASKSVAGSISHISRSSDAPVVLATGAAAINTTIKAVAISRGHLAEELIDLRCYPDLKDNQKMAFNFTLVKSKRLKKTDDAEDFVEIKVGKSTKAGSTAGALKAMVLDGKRVAVTGIGAEPIMQAITAIALARLYLQKEGHDISFRPEWQHLELGERNVSAVRLHILSQQI